MRPPVLRASLLILGSLLLASCDDPRPSARQTQASIEADMQAARAAQAERDRVEALRNVAAEQERERARQAELDRIEREAAEAAQLRAQEAAAAQKAAEQAAQQAAEQARQQAAREAERQAAQEAERQARLKAQADPVPVPMTQEAPLPAPRSRDEIQGQAPQVVADPAQPAHGGGTERPSETSEDDAEAPQTNSGATGSSGALSATRPAASGALGRELARASAIRRGSSGRAEVAITFDDGPSPRFTPQILSVARERQVPLTFFMVGRELRSFPGVARQVAADGHELANHTYSHQTTRMAQNQADWEIARTDELLRQVTGQSPRYYRPPGNHLETGTAWAAAQRGERVITWDSTAEDWQPGRSRDQIVAGIMRLVRPGSIILLHDGGGNRQATVDAFPLILDALEARGLSVVPLEQLLR